MTILQTLLRPVHQWLSPVGVSSSNTNGDTSETLARGNRPQRIEDVIDDPQYRGKIVIQTPEGLYATQSEQRAVQLLRLMQQRYPDSPPVSTVVPDETMMPLPVQVQ